MYGLINEYHLSPPSQCNLNCPAIHLVGYDTVMAVSFHLLGHHTTIALRSIWSAVTLQLLYYPSAWSSHCNCAFTGDGFGRGLLFTSPTQQLPRALDICGFTGDGFGSGLW
jgi:hypothetical protein